MSCNKHFSKANGEFSKTIPKLVENITLLGFSVDLFSRKTSPGASGTVNYEKKEVYINEPCAGCAVVTLAHEIGHILHFIECGHEEQPPKEVREREASERGLRVLRLFVKNEVISDNEWHEEHTMLL